MNEKKIRAILRDTFGNRSYRITRDSEVHVYGQMPNSEEVGWYFFGHLEDPDTLARIRELD